MLAEPSFQPRQQREKVVELMFEKFMPPALFLAKNAVLSSFATGRQTSLVIDMGYEGSVSKCSLTLSRMCICLLFQTSQLIWQQLQLRLCMTGTCCKSPSCTPRWVASCCQSACSNLCGAEAPQSSHSMHSSEGKSLLVTMR